MTMEKIETHTSQLLCDLTDCVATVTLNQPKKRNALSDEMTPALRAIIPILDARKDVRCVVITGAGDGFCSGGDVSEMGSDSLGGGDARTLEEKITVLQHKQRTLTLRLYEMKTPSIAALPGVAAGAGLSIALACDLRIAVDTAFITTGFRNVGLSGDYGGSWLLTKLVGSSVTKDLYFTGRRVTADEAHRMGIFNTVVGEAQFAEQVRETSKTIAEGPPIAIRYMKEHINRADSIDLSACLDIEAEHLLRCAQTSDHDEAVRAFLEKRTPNFTGK